jgi:hypothetical protein
MGSGYRESSHLWQQHREMAMTKFSATMDRLMLAQIALDAAEKRQRRARRKKNLATIGIVLIVTLTGAYLVGLGLLYLMPYN